MENNDIYYSAIGARPTSPESTPKVTHPTTVTNSVSIIIIPSQQSSTSDISPGLLPIIVDTGDKLTCTYVTGSVPSSYVVLVNFLKFIVS